MKISINTIKQLINFELPPISELVERINMQLGQVESVTDLAKQYEDVIIVKVVSCEKHPDADKLSVCKVDDGGAVRDVERDERGLVQVVCGAPNVHADMYAAWLPPRATVPATFHDAEPFVLGARQLRGVMSNGMLAAGDELAINNDHEGIIELDPAEVRPNGAEISAGARFAAVYGLDDTVIELENKMFTHRPDCFGQIGVARELAGILGQPFESPAWYKTIPVLSSGSGLELTVTNDAPDVVPRFMAVALRDVSVAPSPLWLQIELMRLGGKAINNIVDITNYVMLLTAQPTHAYDYDKLRGQALGVRMARDGDTATLLNGKTYEFSHGDIVIVDGEDVIALAGVMGGASTEVSSETKNIVLECANFDMYAVRKSSMRHGLFTDALTRFSKGQSPLQNARVLAYMQTMILDIAGGSQASDVHDCMNDRVRAMIEPDEYALPLTIKPAFIRDRLGVNIPKADMVTLLGNVEFPRCEDCGWNPEDMKDNVEDLHVNVPFWRTDIELPEDIVEEVGRLYGFDKLPRELPKRSIAPAPRNARFELKEKIRTAMQRAGAHEVLTYSFVHEDLLKKATQDPAQAYRISNALSPELQYYRLSVLPSLLEKVHPNIKAGHDEFVLYEIGKGHNKTKATDTDGLPTEQQYLDAVYASKKPHDGSAYYMMRRLLTALTHDLGFTLRLQPVTELPGGPMYAPFEPTRSALVVSRKGDVPLGIVGELKQTVLSKWKLPPYTAAWSLDLAGLQEAQAIKRAQYSALSRFPSTAHDISLRVLAEETYEKVFWTLYQALLQVAGETVDIRLEPLAIYSAPADKDHKVVTLRVTFTDVAKTLTDAEVKVMLDQAAEVAFEQLGAERT